MLHLITTTVCSIVILLSMESVEASAKPSFNLFNKNAMLYGFKPAEDAGFKNNFLTAEGYAKTPNMNAVYQYAKPEDSMQQFNNYMQGNTANNTYAGSGSVLPNGVNPTENEGTKGDESSKQYTVFFQSDNHTRCEKCDKYGNVEGTLLVNDHGVQKLINYQALTATDPKDTTTTTNPTQYNNVVGGPAIGSQILPAQNYPQIPTPMSERMMMLNSANPVPVPLSPQYSGMPQQLGQLNSVTSQRINQPNNGFPQQMGQLNTGIPQLMGQLNSGMAQQMGQTNYGIPQPAGQINSGMPQLIQPSPPQPQQQLMTQSNSYPFMLAPANNAQNVVSPQAATVGTLATSMQSAMSNGGQANQEQVLQRLADALVSSKQVDSQLIAQRANELMNGNDKSQSSWNDAIRQPMSYANLLGTGEVTNASPDQVNAASLLKALSIMPGVPMFFVAQTQPPSGWPQSTIANSGGTQPKENEASAVMKELAAEQKPSDPQGTVDEDVVKKLAEEILGMIPNKNDDSKEPAEQSASPSRR